MISAEVVIEAVNVFRIGSPLIVGWRLFLVLLLAERGEDNFHLFPQLEQFSFHSLQHNLLSRDDIVQFVNGSFLMSNPDFKFSKPVFHGNSSDC